MTTARAPGAGAASPFAVLGVQPDAGAREVERAAQRLLAQLEVGARSARSFALRGERIARTAEDVRAALTVLRDPEQRLAAELCAMATFVELPPPTSVDLWAELDSGLTRPWEREGQGAGARRFG